jgi:hypothetical protein
MQICIYLYKQQKRLEVTILISEKADSQRKTGDKDSQLIIIKGAILEGYITIIDLYETNDRTSQ